MTHLSLQRRELILCRSQLCEGAAAHSLLPRQAGRGIARCGRLGCEVSFCLAQQGGRRSPTLRCCSALSLRNRQCGGCRVCGGLRGSQLLPQRRCCLRVVSLRSSMGCRHRRELGAQGGDLCCQRRPPAGLLRKAGLARLQTRLCGSPLLARRGCLRLGRGEALCERASPQLNLGGFGCALAQQRVEPRRLCLRRRRLAPQRGRLLDGDTQLAVQCSRLGPRAPLGWAEGRRGGAE